MKIYNVIGILSGIIGYGVAKLCHLTWWQGFFICLLLAAVANSIAVVLINKANPVQHNKLP